MATATLLGELGLALATRREIAATLADMRRELEGLAGDKVAYDQLAREIKTLEQEYERLDTWIARLRRQEQQAAEAQAAEQRRARKEAVRAAVLRAKDAAAEFERRAAGPDGVLDGRLADDILAALVEADRLGLGGLSGGTTPWQVFGRSTLQRFCEAWIGRRTGAVPVPPADLRVIPDADNYLNHLNHLR
jgi:hypothetical protein